MSTYQAGRMLSDLVPRIRKTSVAMTGVFSEVPQRGGYGPMEHGPKSIAPKACLYLFTNCEVNNTNGFRFLPVDMRAVLLLVVIFMRLAAETACNE